MKLLLSILILCSAWSATAATYFVSKAGSDTNAGTQAAPWATPAKAASVSAAGDTVYFGAGSYVGAVTFGKSGTATNPITFLGSNAIVVGNENVNGNYIVLSGVTCSPTSAGGYAAVTVNGSYCILTNSPVGNYGAAASDQAAMINLNGNFDKVVNCRFADMNDIDVLHIWGHGHVIQDCVVTNVNEVNYSANHTDFVQTWGSSTYGVIIRRCLVINSTLQLGNTEQDITGGTWGWTFENCIFRNIANTYFSGIPNTKFYNCVFDNVGKNQGMPIYWYASTASGNQRDSTGGEVDNTVFYNCSAMAGNGFNVSLIKQVDNYSGSTPGFLSEAQGNYRLATNSVLVGSGTNRSDVFNDDFAGTLRAATGPWDGGAYVFTNALMNTNLPVDTNVYVITTNIAHVWGGVSTFGLSHPNWVDNGLRLTNVDNLGVTGSNVPPYSTWRNLTNWPASVTVQTNPPIIQNVTVQLPLPKS
jgi:hypothetical protein